MLKAVKILTGYVCIVESQSTAYNKVAETHSDCTPNKQCSPSNLVDEEEHDRGENDKQSVLYTRRDEINVPGEVCHVKYVNDIVRHDVCPR
jgi:hypothetical protein